MIVWKIISKKYEAQRTIQPQELERKVKVMVKKRKTNKWTTRIIAMFTLALMLVWGNSISSEAVTIATRTWDNTTFTGSNVYVTDNGPTGHYVMTLSATQMSAVLCEYIVLKDINGTEKTPISTYGERISSISTRTNTFYGGTYTMKGLYCYSVTSGSGKKYDFSVIY
ncbi:MAG: hypothetical protein ACI4D8_07955 [Wujia sp.]